MDRADKIFTILAFAAMIAVLVSNTKRAGLPAVNTSAAPSTKSGPAYLLSALPLSRRSDDYADAVSYYQADNAPYNAWGNDK